MGDVKEHPISRDEILDGLSVLVNLWLIRVLFKRTWCRQDVELGDHWVEDDLQM